MTIITQEDVEVTDTETEIIEPQETPSEKTRHFAVVNGENEIEVKVWGSNDCERWVERDSRTIEANGAGALICEPTVCWVKITGKTTTSSTTSIVDVYLFY